LTHLAHKSAHFVRVISADTLRSSYLNVISSLHNETLLLTVFTHLILHHHHHHFISVEWKNLFTKLLCCRFSNSLIKEIKLVKKMLFALSISKAQTHTHVRSIVNNCISLTLIETWFCHPVFQEHDRMTLVEMNKNMLKNGKQE
jgi:hypothetical protein